MPGSQQYFLILWNDVTRKTRVFSWWVKSYCTRYISIATPHVLTRLQSYINLCGPNIVISSISVSINQLIPIPNYLDLGSYRWTVYESHSKVIITANRCPECSMSRVVSPAIVKKYTVKLNRLVRSKCSTRRSKASRKGYRLSLVQSTIHWNIRFWSQVKIMFWSEAIVFDCNISTQQFRCQFSCFYIFIYIGHFRVKCTKGVNKLIAIYKIHNIFFFLLKLYLVFFLRLAFIKKYITGF